MLASGTLKHAAWIEGATKRGHQWAVGLSAKVPKFPEDMAPYIPQRQRVHPTQYLSTETGESLSVLSHLILGVEAWISGATKACT
jgi:hypothetical protein